MRIPPPALAVNGNTPSCKVVVSGKFTSWGRHMETLHHEESATNCVAQQRVVSATFQVAFSDGPV